jgi:hypothetical protein
MAALKTKLGRIPCPVGCGHSVVLKKNEAETLTVQCEECDVSAFAKKGTGAARKWLSQLPKEAAQVPEEKAPVHVPGIVPKAQKKPFSLEGL